SIEMETGLDEYIETGIPLDADISGELLINIFIPNTPLHDGAVIIKDYKIAAAAGYLPLSESSLIPKELGTRHRAAIGLSEVT
ncbi:diadenylate cyclase, partial [Agathobacter rectalis]